MEGRSAASTAVPHARGREGVSVDHSSQAGVSEVFKTLLVGNNDTEVTLVKGR